MPIECVAARVLVASARINVEGKINRGGNRPSAEGAAVYLDHAIALCRRAGFAAILLRGDTDFSQTTHLDRWSEQGVGFVFGFDANKALVERADALACEQYHELERRAQQAFAEREERQKQPRIKGDLS